MPVDSRAKDRKLDANFVANRLGQWSNSQDRGHQASRYRLLAASLGERISSREFRDSDQLPPERALAAALGTSRGTVVAAYELLRSQGLVDRVQGRGTIVTATDPTDAMGSMRGVGDPLYHPPPTALDLMMAIPEPLTEVLDLMAAIDLRQHATALASCEPAGLPDLRQAIASLMTAQGLPTTVEEIIVTAGAQQAIALIASQLAKPGDVVLTEETTWPGLTDSARRAGARVVGIPMDQHGIIVEELEAAIQRFRPAFIGVNPHNHNPTGTCVPPTRREQIAKVAADYAVPLVEDRVTARINFHGSPPPVPLAAHHRHAPGITVDSVNKLAWPGLRIGWLRADPALARELRSSRALADMFSPPQSQLAALAVLENLDRVTNARVDQLSHRMHAAVDAMRRCLPTWELAEPNGGLVLWARLPSVSAAAFAEFAPRFGVAVASGREFSSSIASDEHIRVPYTAPTDVLLEGIARLGRAWEAFTQLSPPPEPSPRLAVV